jgi:hypothetical protein
LQDAWIQHASIRDNILLCSSYDEARYKRVLAACALEDDVAAMVDGDLTEVGERGFTLSGAILHPPVTSISFATSCLAILMWSNACQHAVKCMKPCRKPELTPPDLLFHSKSVI